MKLLDQKIVKMHLFCSESMELPSSLKKAFPAARTIVTADLVGGANTVVWLHLNAKQTIAQQVSSVKAVAPESLLVVMSDLLTTWRH